VGGDDLVGRRVVAIIPPRSARPTSPASRRHLATGDARALGVDLELPVLRRDGTEVACRFLIESTRRPPAASSTSRGSAARGAAARR
jgi:hypothetical protein